MSSIAKGKPENLQAKSNVKPKVITKGQKEMEKVKQEVTEVKMSLEEKLKKKVPIYICADYPGKESKVPKTEMNKKSSKAMRAAFLKAKIWPAKTTINVAFLKDPPADLERTSIRKMRKQVDKDGVALSIDPLQETIDTLPVKEAIIKVVTERLQPIVNVKFNFFDKDNKLLSPAKADIRIAFDPNGGAWSLLGTDCLDESDVTVETMNFGWFDVPTTLHEFCHALGMVHEHQNPAGKVINWAVDRVLMWAKESQGWDEATTKNNIINRYKMDQINGSRFDPKSIMLYFFPSDLVNNDQGKCCGDGTNQNLQFSPFDVLFLNKNYPTSKELTPDQFTVKFFNDVFNQKVDIKMLQDELAYSDSVEKDDKFKTGGAGAGPLSAAKATKGSTEKFALNSLRTPTETFEEQKCPECPTCPEVNYETSSNHWFVVSIVFIIFFIVFIAYALFNYLK